ncbi:MAG TPA: hypothetical protein VM580_20730 [Labilithrix sp.]|jgi:hypothetical protein|nr:hypothetical protein [Labilithrix sp.]
MRTLVRVLVTLVILLVGRRALAGPKEECLEAHGRAQTERDKGQLSVARQSFMACAQAMCPSIVQAECSRQSEELTRAIPNVTFVARDSNGTDLPATSVFVDDVLVATRLDDGKAYDVDPGKHTIRYVNDGRETTLRVVLNQGEKGRVLVATFTAAHASRAVTAPALEPVSSPKRSAAPLVLSGVGGAAVATGAVMLGIGLAGVPSNCTFSTRECAAPANDPAFAEAKDAASLANTGMVIGIAGAAAVVGGLVWYLLQPAHPTETRRGKLSLPYAVSF